MSSHGARARGTVADNDHLFPLMFVAPVGASERRFSRPRQGSNSMITTNTFAATRSTGLRTVATYNRPVGAIKDEDPPARLCGTRARRVPAPAGKLRPAAQIVWGRGCIHHFTREKRHWWVQSTHPTCWSTDPRDPPRKSQSCAVVLIKSLSLRSPRSLRLNCFVGVGNAKWG